MLPTTIPSGQRYGFGLAIALIRPEMFLRRRVETIRFTETGDVRRHTTIDVDLDRLAHLLPARHSKEAPSNRVQLVPMTMLRKQPLALLNVVDDSGRTIPVLDTEENGLLAYRALCAHAAVTLDLRSRASLPAELGKLLEEVARAPARRARLAAERLLRPDSPWVGLARDPVFRRMTRDLAENFILIGRVFTPSGSEPSVRSLKFSYASDLGVVPHRRWTKALGLLRAGEREFEVGLPAIADCVSFHAQVVPPAGLKVKRVVLQKGSPFGSSRPTNETEGSHTGNVGHVNANHVPPGTYANLVIKLCATSRGAMFAAMSASVATACLLVALSLQPESRVASLQAARGNTVVLLLIIPGLISTYLARPGEPSVVGRVLRTVRILLLVNSLTLYVVAGSFVLGTAGSALRTVFSAVAIVASACAILLSVSWARCQRVPGG